MCLAQMENGPKHQLAEVGIHAFILPVNIEGTLCLPKYSKDYLFTSVFFVYPNFVLAIVSLHSTSI